MTSLSTCAGADGAAQGVTAAGTRRRVVMYQAERIPGTTDLITRRYNAGGKKRSFSDAATLRQRSSCA